MLRIRYWTSDIVVKLASRPSRVGGGACSLSMVNHVPLFPSDGFQISMFPVTLKLV